MDKQHPQSNNQTPDQTDKKTTRGKRGNGKNKKKNRNASYRQDTHYSPNTSENFTFTNKQRENEISELKSFSSQKRSTDFEFTPGTFPTLFDDEMTEITPIAHFDIQMQETLFSVDALARQNFRVTGNIDASVALIASTFLAYAIKATAACDQYGDPRPSALSRLLKLQQPVSTIAATLSSVLGNFKTEEGDFRLANPGWYATRFALCAYYAIKQMNASRDVKISIRALKIWNKFRRTTFDPVNDLIIHNDERLLDPVEINAALNAMFDTRRAQYTISRTNIQTDEGPVILSKLNIPRVTTACASFNAIITALGTAETIALKYGTWLTADEISVFLSENHLAENQHNIDVEHLTAHGATVDITKANFKIIISEFCRLYGNHVTVLKTHFESCEPPKNPDGSKVQSVLYHAPASNDECFYYAYFRLSPVEQQLCALSPLAFTILEWKEHRHIMERRTVTTPRLELLVPYFKKIQKIKPTKDPPK